jgi:hypothetical protein
VEAQAGNTNHERRKQNDLPHMHLRDSSDTSSGIDLFENQVCTLAGRVTMEVILHVRATRIRKTAEPPPTALLSSCDNGKLSASRMVPLQAGECKKSRLIEGGKDLSY